MTIPDSFKTIISLSESKLKEKGSQFITFSKPINSEEQALIYLEELRKKFYDATHHCYSYKLMNGEFKYSDDGEPNGTAGIRIYNAQNHFDLTNLITVVVRYFGGTKLGVGPLGKAYYDAAADSLSNINIVTLVQYQTLEVKFDFSLSKTIHHLVNKYNALIKENTFDDLPGILLFIKEIDKNKFVEEITRVTLAKCKIIDKHHIKYLPAK